MGSRPVSLSVVIMAFNEKGAIEAQVRDTLTFLDRKGLEGEVVAVDDGSTDGTGELLDRLALDEPRVRPVHHPRNLGMGVAIRSGYNAARMEYLTQLPGDGQVAPGTLERFLGHLDDTDLVLSTYSRRDDGAARWVVSHVYQSIAWMILGDTCRFTGTMVFRRALLERFRLASDTFMVNVEVPLKLMKMGVEPAMVTIEAVDRAHGRSKVLSASGVAGVIHEMLALRRELVLFSAHD
ncbi:MAG: glycosyltransferase family 2 protein [Deltaproteobacteria bacterium]|nr:glycosyltransferase family 2 protein [Deltaproteobacteria bacterium]